MIPEPLPLLCRLCSRPRPPAGGWPAPNLLGSCRKAPRAAAAAAAELGARAVAAAAAAEQGAKAAAAVAAAEQGARAVAAVPKQGAKAAANSRFVVTLHRDAQGLGLGHLLLATAEAGECAATLPPPLRRCLPQLRVCLDIAPARRNCGGACCCDCVERCLFEPKRAMIE